MTTLTSFTTPTTTSTTTTARRNGTDADRRAALIGGVLYLVTFAASIPTLALKATINDHPGAFVLGAGSTSSVLWAGLMDVVCGLAGIGTAVALYQVAKRYSPMGARGFLASRTLEASMLFAGVLALFAIVTMRHDVAGSAGTDTAATVTVATALAAVHRWAFLLGPGIMPAVSAVFIGTAMRRSRLVPRWMPTLGLIGAPLLVASSVATMFGGHGQVSDTATLCAMPIAVWEFSFGMWLTFKGFVPNKRRNATHDDDAVAA